MRSNIWQQQPEAFRREATINVDGTITATVGECKEGMGISYDGQWGFHPLVISLHNTREPLFIVNRLGNAPSHLDSAPWIDKGLDLVCSHFKKVNLRGGTDFSLTEHLDKWDERCTFIFGVDAMPNLVKMANEIDESEWQSLEGQPKYQVKTKTRRKPDNIKQAVLKKRKLKKIQTSAEDFVHLVYRPKKCQKTYRLIILRKTLEVTRGEVELFDDVRYFLYITNDWERSTSEMIRFYRGRSNHVNDIDQLKIGLNALAPASDTLLSKWALMIASLVWDLKAWFGLLLPYQLLGLSIIRMEFKRFLNTFIRIPCLIIRTSRRIRHKIVG